MRPLEPLYRPLDSAEPMRKGDEMRNREGAWEPVPEMYWGMSRGALRVRRVVTWTMRPRKDGNRWPG